MAPTFITEIISAPVHIALRHESGDLCRLLLDHGANPNATDIWDNTPLYVASSSGQIAVVLLLLEYGARMSIQDVLGYTLLHEAVIWRGGRVEVMRLLLVDRPRRGRERTKRWLDCIALGSKFWTPPGCGGLTETWRGSACPDRCGKDTLPNSIAAEQHGDHAIVIGAHCRGNAGFMTGIDLEMYGYRRR